MKKNIYLIPHSTFWDHFYKISQIPRPSKNEKAICQYVMGLAKDLGLNAEMDRAGGHDFGNIVVKVPASPGYEQAPIVIIQSHLDIVALPEERKNEPLELILDGTILRASGSTLGADNGVAIAIVLTLMTEKEIVHGPLELLFTIDEETGMTGAHALSDSVLSGKYLINIDSEEEDVLTVGCAGGNRTYINMRLVTESPAAGYTPIRLIASGFKGGHSGMEINRGRANAGQLLARLLFVERGNFNFRLVELGWGTVDNAIPSEAFAVVMVKIEQLADLKSALKRWEESFRKEYGSVETNLEITFEEDVNPPDYVLTQVSMTNTLALLVSLPHGAAKMSPDIPGLVETSSNLAVVKMDQRELSISISQRSSTDPSLDWIVSKCEACAILVGANWEHSSRYSGWQPNMQSKLLEVCERSYKSLFGKSPGVSALHAGLECGLIGAKYPDMDMISIGPTIWDAHTPTKAGFRPGVDSGVKGERMDTARMSDFWKFVQAVLKNLAE
ncbi:MAG: hypothetical protein B6244_08935 [Candidatus Cloacimonetes bacterium 4572_55]|nr:MAG: hypothetical protein B6244_08935 [Candidatus Cloacimonetes bacterium 4572_55]